jgi:intracellular septation protein
MRQEDRSAEVGAPVSTLVPDSSPARSLPEPVTKKSDEKAGLKLLIDLVPLAVFFIAYRFTGLVTATAILVACTLLSVVAAKLLLGKVSPMLIVSAVLVTVFGGLTLGLDDPRFIKIKPTIVNLLFAGALSFGVLTKRNLMQMMMGEALQLTEAGWRQLTLRWIGLFVVLAALNELVWRTQSEQTWVNFKFPGTLVVTIGFMALQAPLIRRHSTSKS